MLDAIIFEPHPMFGALDADDYERPFPFGYLSKASGPMPVFELQVLLEWPREELAGYARLMAAAPDLHSDGKAFLKAVEALCDWMNGNDLSADHESQKPEDFKAICESMVAFRAALAKATGAA